MAKKGTKAYEREYAWVVYGINPRMKRVQSVWVQRNGVLSGTRDDGTPVLHPIKPGWSNEREASLIFGLREVFSVPAELSDSDFTKKRLAELREKAAKWTDDTSESN
jgi:hypothetical protein